MELMDQESKLFGTEVRWISTGFRDFLDSPQNNKGPYHYLITQYSDDDDDVPDTFPPPTNALKDDFPLVPPLMGNLVLQQENLWVGKSKEGSCSGLHYDFHDNFYCLFQGRERFVLYPPSQSHCLHPHGKTKKVQPNGRISYEHNPVRSDGLNSYDAAKYKMQALKRRMSELKSSSKARAMDVKLIKKAYEEARNALEAQEEKGKMNENGEEEWGGIGGNDEDESDDEEDPSSFPAYAHPNLRPPFPFESPNLHRSSVHLRPFHPVLPLLAQIRRPALRRYSQGGGDALPPCLVVARSSSSPSGIHMAFNYWFVLPYKDSLVWKYLWDEQRAAYGVKGALKRKNEEKDALATSTKPINKEKILNL
ncbi:hypothetical protein FRC04_003511 [Tulasnella sp. 424]|nr:hypothetical protein FRC04_003511 [Tulasnella sp. 424]KAG8962868.1 hypothetical protein FRC05_005076 [Tulasnella sp. 425]